MGPENPKRMDGYARASRKGTREGASFQSPEQQRAAISGWAASKGIEIAEWRGEPVLPGPRLTWFMGLDSVAS